MEDESKAWDSGVLEDLKRQRDALVSIREMFDRRERLDKDNIPSLERRIQNNETKLAGLRAKPEGMLKPGEIEKVVEAIIKVRISPPYDTLLFLVYQATHISFILSHGFDADKGDALTGQGVDRQPAQPVRVRQGVPPGRADLLPTDAVSGQPVEPRLGARASQVLGDARGQLEATSRRARGHAARGLETPETKRRRRRRRRQEESNGAGVIYHVGRDNEKRGRERG
ncbi:hypothetical protein NPX13_g5917 [Xylaria arbuscula]|uniref:Sorting nexin 8/Mvp1 BAR domain-containing protein n=1 Tax=Xylaria arbuscula TaxID=114810 RepID=A0A9W8NCU5_9PEZI|nr:hypothetical protein NPX13_g5917 [Xylaria arbuscula]